MPRGTSRTRAVLTRILLSGPIAFDAGDPASDLDGILSDYDISEELTPRERRTLAQQLERLVDMAAALPLAADEDGLGSELLERLGMLDSPVDPSYVAQLLDAIEDDEPDMDPRDWHGPGPDWERYDTKDPYDGLDQDPDESEFPYDALGLFDGDYGP